LLTIYNLLIDIGNTNTKWLLIPTEYPLNKASNLPLYTFSNQFPEFDKINNNIDNLNINKVLISNVSSENYLILLIQSLNININKISIYKTPKSYKNLINNYKDYTTLGTDRWLSMIAVNQMYETQANIIISCGSATTIDIINNNIFIGGYIIAGLNFMQNILLNKTAKINTHLNDEEIKSSIRLGLNTKECVEHGAILAQVGFIEKAIFSFIKDKDIVKYNCIIHGGAAEKICPFISLPHEKMNNLVVLGLSKVLND